MEREEFKVLVKGMKAVYADAKFIADKDAFDVWYGLLKDLDYNKASAAIQKHMMTSKYPPTIADIREQCVSLSQERPLDELEAWSMVRRALRNCGYNFEEEYNKLPTLVQRAIGSPGQLFQWATDEEYNDSVASSHFMRSYRAVAQSANSYSKLNDDIRQKIDMVNIASQSRQIGVKNDKANNSKGEDNKSRQGANTDVTEVSKKKTEPVNPEDRVNKLKERWNNEKNNRE